MDLYVLERAFTSTHPESEPMFASILSSYGKQMGKEWPSIHRRLDDGKIICSSNKKLIFQGGLHRTSSSPKRSQTQHGGLSGDCTSPYSDTKRRLIHHAEINSPQNIMICPNL